MKSVQLKDANISKKKTTKETPIMNTNQQAKKCTDEI